MATKLTNNSVDFTFHGDRTTYSELIAKHDQDLSISKIGYIKNPQDIHRRLQKPVYPPRVIPGEGPEAKYEFNKQLESFKGFKSSLPKESRKSRRRLRRRNRFIHQTTCSGH
jgi:hypothetical protein